MHLANTLFQCITYLVAFNSQAIGGTKEILCAHIYEPSTPISLVVTLNSNNGNVTILKEASIKKNFYKCVPFQVPVVLIDTVATVYVKIEGATTSLNKTTQILIKPPMKLLFIQTDKPIYKPGERVKFRIVSLDSNFLTHNQKDPNSNRIGQWLNRTTKSGILDLFHLTTLQALKGYYTITVWNEKNVEMKQSFEIKEYVLPKFEVNVNLPSMVTAMDKEFMLQVCSKYTYGKPMQGSVTAEVCGVNHNYEMEMYMYRFVRSRPGKPNFSICKTFDIKTDKTGCVSRMINVTEYGMTVGAFFRVNSKVVEDGTGITVTGTSTVSYTSDVIIVSFVDAPEIYKPGIGYEGKLLVSNVQSKPLKDQTLYLVVTYESRSFNVTLTTDIKGTADFSLDTTDWSNQTVFLQAQHKEDNNQYWPAPRYYQKSSHWLRPFYSKSKSFLKLIKAPNALSCVSDAVVEASYIIPGSALKNGQKTLNFFYVVSSKGSMIGNGHKSVKVEYRKENKGKLSFTLKKTTALSPFAQVVVYTVLPNGETVADSWSFPVEQCLPNKVSVNFSSSTALPKETTTLNLKAQPGSLCSVRSIDQSVLLLKPEAQLNAASVFGRLPHQILVGYPYQVDDYRENPCFPSREMIEVEEPIRNIRKHSFHYSYYYRGNNDAYSMFKAIGIKIITNSDVKKCEYEYVPLMEYREPGSVSKVVRDSRLEARLEPLAQNPIRKFFPETWIWDLVPVGRSGSVNLTKTVPDTITKWATDAFCTSSVGFGVAPSTALTAFMPFFVSLTLPYSVICREVVILKATVFNYLSKCIMVKVTLAISKQFKVSPFNVGNYTQCVCSEESKTFEWIVTPTYPGRMNIAVTAEAVQTQELCGNEEVTVPERGHIDTVVHSLLVEAEGTKQIVTHNELICLTGNQMNTTVPLTLPELFIEGSAQSFVTVLGDLIGRALKNIADLLRMPYGCGEQKMAILAPNIYILQYLESSGQLTPEILARAKTFLETGYQIELTFKHDDGSYSLHGMRDASGNTWLTAFVMKTFGGAKKYVFIDQTHIDQAKTWLSQQQQTNGCYASVGPFVYSLMRDGVSDHVTLTAYITAALLEMGINKSDPMVAKGLECMKKAPSNLNNIFFTALSFYTYTLAGDQEMRQKLISNLDSQAKREGIERYWSNTQYNRMVGSFEVEMSSYVLLGLLSGPLLPNFGLNYSATIVRWLAKRQNPNGGFSSTQDTVVALQALAKYSAATYSPTGTVVVSVTSPSRQKYNFTINQQNRLLYQERQLQPPTGNFTLAARGQGCAFVQLHVLQPRSECYFSLRQQKEHTCFIRCDCQTNMVIIDVNLLSGFVLDDLSLQALQQDSRIKLVEQNEGHVILYLDGMKVAETKSFNMSLRQDVVVKDLKPASVTVYDYYTTYERAVRKYTPPCNCHGSASFSHVFLSSVAES
ncbi:putative alpha-2-macroglobulin-like protein 1 [Triplophysa rosa]|uniref:Alpha-2-macroglobulin-like protein 1 n=1 Tax=Triplophysa rosa TaxID=992332 RepID=A0A9W7TKT3_TRIRA|nr:putative alpha-2-macroglobulin-like protein 1 [Triplophysa rosa]